MSNKYIGVFDSGLGGVSVIKYLKEYLPNESIVFLADYKNCPYGSKSKEQLLEIVKKNISFINQFDLKAVAVACNTADGVAGNMIEDYFNLPISRIIRPTCQEALNQSSNKRIGVIATKACIDSGEYQKTLNDLDKNAMIFPLATPALVTLVESKKYTIECEDTVETLKDYLDNFKDTGIDTLILGCTHYDLLKDICKSLLKDVNIVSSSKCVADFTLKHLNDLSSEKGDRKFFVTADKQKFDELSSHILDEKIDSIII